LLKATDVLVDLRSKNIIPDNRKQERIAAVKSSTRRVLIVIALLLALPLLLIGFNQYRYEASRHPWDLVCPEEYTAQMTSMVELRQKGQFEEAIQIASHSLKDQPSDEFPLQMIATAYFERAQQDQSQMERWGRLGAEYAEKAYNASPTDLANIFNLGESYRLAGDDLSTSECCQYYEESLRTFEKLTPLLQDDRATIHGENFRLAPFRKENQERIAEVKRDLSKCSARRPASGEQGHLDEKSIAALNLMSEFAKQGQYEEAIDTGLKALKNKPSDRPFYQQISIAYLARAYKEPDQSANLAQQAVEYTEKALAAGGPKKPFIDLIDAEGTYELVGDLSTPQHCLYYQKALGMLNELAPLIAGDEVVAGREAVPLAPIRANRERVLNRLNGKIAAAGCK
jgi:tetratricopeptide (TPR) repeat protein